jgi:hypothetical protein
VHRARYAHIVGAPQDEPRPWADRVGPFKSGPSSRGHRCVLKSEPYPEAGRSIVACRAGRPPTETRERRRRVYGTFHDERFIAIAARAARAGVSERE